MKKFLSVLMIFAVVLSCCACGTKKEAAEETAALDPHSPEAMYGNIDQTTPIDGYYKIWNAEGVKNMANHPDGKFELLCNVDMGGAALAPIPEFTGTIKGGNFTISNFVLQGGDETDFGFVTVNKGDIHNLLLDNVTFVPGANAKNIGSLAGINEGTLLRCTVTGTLTVEAAAEDASCGSVVGTNTGSLTNTIATVDVTYTAPGSAKVGGIVGTAKGGTIEFIDTYGKLDITGSSKTAGLFAGESSDVVLTNCAFVGETNAIDGKLFTNFTGNEDDDETATVVGGKWRDNAAHEPLPENVQALRDRVEQAMYALGSVEWTVSQDLRHGCTCQLTACHGVYNSNTIFIGLPYNHKGGSLARFQYCQDENGVLKDFVYDMADFDGYDAYIGDDCSTSVIHAWWSVSNSVDFMRTRYQLPYYDMGTIAVGDWAWEENLGNYTEAYLEATGEQQVYEAYAKIRKGDAYIYLIDLGGHTRMASADAVVVRDQNGQINPDYSYVLSHEQGAPSGYIDDIHYTSWRLNYKYTFANLYYDTALPVTCEELLTGEMEPVECSLIDGQDGKLGLTCGTVKANYFLDSVDMVITDSKGETVMDHTMWTTVGRYYDGDHNDIGIRNYCDSYDMANFATPLQKVPFEVGETYHYTITANLATGDHIQVKDGSFVNGEA